jgi:DNA-binding NarL/FixJ family response regulator
LSIKEIKFLSFIKEGLSNKQIASMQNITTSAVHKMRYRIKKKLQLDKDTSIDDFIINL